MNDQSSSSPKSAVTFSEWMRTSLMLKLFIVGVLMLLLLIPQNMVMSLVSERERLRDESITEISSKWGYAQTIAGAMITIPYQITVKDERGNMSSQTAYAHFLPDQLRIKGNLMPEKRYRGIYTVVLYNTKLHVEGNFSKLDFDKFSDLQKSDAELNIGISDMKGITKSISVNINGKQREVSPGLTSSDNIQSGVSLPISLESDTIHFSYDLDLNGSTEINFLPLGKETDVDLSGTWGNPSFQGVFLPDQRNITENAFSAKWNVLQLNRNYPQQSTGNFIDVTSFFGVKLLLPVDEYQKTMRSAKYGIMLIVITFISFFFIEVLNRKKIHPIQYILVGFAIVLFYVLLLSFAEHFNFNKAYLIGSLAILSLIGFYSYFVFMSKKLAAIFTGLLAILYGFFYSLMQLQDYALLLGSLGLLLVLAVIMYLTRHIDWYNVNKE